MKNYHFRLREQESMSRSCSISYSDENPYALVDMGIRLVERCTILQNNGIVDTTDKDCIFPLGYGQRLGEALLGNTQMDKLLLRLSDLICAKQMNNPYTPDPNLDDPHISEEDWDTLRKAWAITCREVEDRLTPLLHYLRSSTALKTLILKKGRFSNGIFREDVYEIGDLVMDAVYSNPGSVSLTCNAIIRPSPFSRFLNAAKCLPHLCVKLSAFFRCYRTYYTDGSDSDDSDAGDDYLDLVTAFGKNQSLTHLTLRGNGNEHRDLARDVLAQLVSHPKIVALKLIQLISSAAVQEALFTLLRSKSSQVKELTLDGFYFYHDEWERFNSVLPSSAIHSLTIGGTKRRKFGEESTQAFLRSNLPTRLTLPNDPSMFSGTSFENVVSHLMTKSSLLKHLTVTGPVKDAKLFENHDSRCFSLIQEQDAAICLSSMTVWVAKMMDLPGLAHCLARSPALQEVEICVSVDDGAMDFAAEILKAVRMSASLFRVEIRHEGSSIVSGDMETKLRAYLGRNQVFFGMRRTAMNPFYGETEIRCEPHVYPAFLAASNALGLVRSTVMMGLVGITGDCLGPQAYMTIGVIRIAGQFVIAKGHLVDGIE
jgi:hypothetical protein